jgi:hypothetical protein
MGNTPDPAASVANQSTKTPSRNHREANTGCSSSKKLPSLRSNRYLQEWKRRDELRYLRPILSETKG